MIDDLIILHKNASELADRQKTDPREFALIRRHTFGASDSSVLLGVNPWKSLAELIEEKQSTNITEEELAIGQKVNVRKGADLESLILDKFDDMIFDITHKPKEMYGHPKYPYLSVNFDGLMDSTDIPVECKFVSTYANKYWNLERGATTLKELDEQTPIIPSRILNIEEDAKATGIPVYYYTQCQQQILFADSDICYLAALFDKDWTLRVYKVQRNQPLINKLIEVAYLNKKYLLPKEIKPGNI